MYNLLLYSEYPFLMYDAAILYLKLQKRLKWYNRLDSH